jgi:hypothetical protein
MSWEEEARELIRDGLLVFPEELQEAPLDVRGMWLETREGKLAILEAKARKVWTEIPWWKRRIVKFLLWLQKVLVEQ